MLLCVKQKFHLHQSLILRLLLGPILCPLMVRFHPFKWLQNYFCSVRIVRHQNKSREFPDSWWRKNWNRCSLVLVGSWSGSWQVDVDHSKWFMVLQQGQFYYWRGCWVSEDDEELYECITKWCWSNLAWCVQEVEF